MAEEKVETAEKIDFLTRLRIRELVLMGLITITAVLANLPEDYVHETLGVSAQPLVAVLGIAVILGLFLYLKFFFFLAVALLITGANMPEQIAEGLHISKLPILLALMALVCLGLVNTIIKLLPSGLEPKPREKSAEGIRALFYAIDKNNLVYAHKVLAMRFDANLHHENGHTPLAYAAMKGSLPMVELLLRHSADPNLVTKEGDTAVEVALRYHHDEVADFLRRARRSADGTLEVEPVLHASR
jgi:uncharacterized protein